MRIPLIVTNEDNHRIPRAIFKKVDVRLFEQHYDKSNDDGSEFEVDLIDFMPPVTFKVVNLLPFYPQDLARRSFVLESSGVNWFDLEEYSPNDDALRRLLSSIERKLIACLSSKPD